MPQQAVLLLSASGAIGAIILGQFADGIPRDWQFIAADKIDVILIAIQHAIAVMLSGIEDAA
jgi:hypothetical protein